MKSRVLTVAVAVALMSGCAVNKTLQATGGSRSDGTVKLSYEYGAFEKPVVDWDAAKTQAAQRCAAWGYSGAEPFGGERRECQASDMYGSCTYWLVTVEYQCTGKPSED